MIVGKMAKKVNAFCHKNSPDFEFPPLFVCLFGSPLAVTSATATLPGVYMKNIHINPIYNDIYIKGAMISIYNY